MAKDCNDCKDWSLCKGYAAYEPRDIRFCRHQIKWLIENLTILHEIVWPEGYEHDIPRRKHPSGRGYFETPIDYAVEVERRLENCGFDGLMLYLLYAYNWTEQMVANYYRTDVEDVRYRAEAVLWHISGWNYRARAYRRWNVYRAYEVWKSENS